MKKLRFCFAEVSLLGTEDEIYDLYAEYRLTMNDNYDVGGTDSAVPEVFGGAIFQHNQSFGGTLKYKLKFCYDWNFYDEAQTGTLYRRGGASRSRYYDDTYR